MLFCSHRKSILYQDRFRRRDMSSIDSFDIFADLISVMQLALVDDSDCLAFRSCNRLGGHQMDLGANTQHGPHGSVQGLFPCLDIGDLVGELLGGELDINIESICVVDAVDLDLVVGRVALFEENGLDLAGEHVDAADDHHVVAAAHGLGHLDMCPPAGAFLTGEDADVLGAVTQEGEAFLVEGSEDQCTSPVLGSMISA